MNIYETKYPIRLTALEIGFIQGALSMIEPNDSRRDLAQKIIQSMSEQTNLLFHAGDAAHEK